MSKKKEYQKYYTSQCLEYPPEETIQFKKENREAYKDEKKIDYVKNKTKWCSDCGDIYQDVCGRTIVNLAHIEEKSDKPISKDYIKSFGNFIKELDTKLNNNTYNKSTRDLVKDLKRSKAFDKYINMCIEPRKKHHKFCIRKKEDINKKIDDINSDDILGDSGHKQYLTNIIDIQSKANKSYTSLKNLHNNSKSISIGKPRISEKPTSHTSLKKSPVHQIIKHKREKGVNVFPYPEVKTYDEPSKIKYINKPSQYQNKHRY